MTDRTETLARGPEIAPREPNTARPNALDMGTNRAQVAELYRRKHAAGLIDCKFFVGNKTEAVTEIVCGEILHLEDAVTRNKVFPLVFDDRV